MPARKPQRPRSLQFPTSHPDKQTVTRAMEKERDGFSLVLQEIPPGVTICFPVFPFLQQNPRWMGDAKASQSCLQPSCKQPRHHPSLKCQWTGLQRVAKTM